MVGLLEIMIYLLCIYLVYKGIEIFQSAFVSSRDDGPRKAGMVIGIIAICVAILVGFAAVVMTQVVTEQMSQNLQSIPR